MNITIVMGFFLPMPPVAGGATEKSWNGLARQFTACGHKVVIISRMWPGWPESEVQAGVEHRRLLGYDHTARLALNLWRDFKWSWRVWCALPAADVTIVNSVTLPSWVGWLRRDAGKIVVMPGRMPKGQFRVYRRIDRVLAVSTSVRDALLEENPALRANIRITGYPIDWSALAGARGNQSGVLTIGYIGRLHREKGLDLLAGAIELLAQQTDLPPWRVLLCGPSDIPHGGSGDDYADELRERFAKAVSPARLTMLPPSFDSTELAAIYRSIDIFCYPSIAGRGETFGVAVAEAMAAGAIPVVSHLPCFTDFVRDGVNGITFDHMDQHAESLLASKLTLLLQNSGLRSRLGAHARLDSNVYDFPQFAARLLEDFSSLK
jgi:glycosyltransferase involved in cell wall biosynthesis